MSAVDVKIQEILDAIAAEKLEVGNKIEEQSKKIQELIDAQGADNPALVAKLEEIKTGVQGIFTPEV